MSTAPTTFEGLIDSWGIAPCAQALGLSYSTVNAMKQRNSIPAKYFPRIIENAPSRFGITAELLIELAAKAGKVAA